MVLIRSLMSTVVAVALLAGATVPQFGQARTRQQAPSATAAKGKAAKAAKTSKAAKAPERSAHASRAARIAELQAELKAELRAARSAERSAERRAAGGSKAKLSGKAARLAAAREARLEALQARRDRQAERAGQRTLALSRTSLAPSAMALGTTRASYGHSYGLNATQDALDLKSSVALVVDQDTSEVLFSKNTDAVLPIASLTKLMTAVVVLDARQPLDELLEVTAEDIDTEKNSRSRLKVGTQLTRGEMLHIALMSSENRAANALGRHYPGGLQAAVQAMNRKALTLGMTQSRYMEPTGLSSQNQSTAADLAKLVKAAYQYPTIRELSTSPEHQVWTGAKTLTYRNTNGLVKSPSWDIGLQKTGYIAEAGRCLVMQAKMSGRRLIMVFLDSAGKYSRIGDAERVRHWLESGLQMDAGGASSVLVNSVGG